MAGPLRLSSTISGGNSCERTRGSGAHTGFGPECNPAQGTNAPDTRCCGVSDVVWFFDLLPLFDSEWLIGLMFFTLTAVLIAFGVPGVLMPISFSSGALLGGWEGMGVVCVGALLGSQAFFVVTRRWLSAGIRSRWGERLKRFDGEIERRGFVYLLGLRLVGVPHVALTAASALSPIRARSFALATLLGFSPAIALAAMAGSAV